MHNPIYIQTTVIMLPTDRAAAVCCSSPALNHFTLVGKQKAERVAEGPAIEN